jgi:C-terminal processing protease CtpA/Prc
MDYSWSPDGKWLAIEARTPEWDLDIWVVSADGEKDPVNVTRTTDSESDPRWSPDGKFLVYSGGEWGERSIYSLRLTPEPDEFEEAFLLHEEEEKDEGEKGEGESADEKKENGSKKKDKKDQEEVKVEIDWDDIHLRAKRISTLQGSASSPMVGPESKWVYFFSNATGNWEMYAVKIDGGDQRSVRKSSPSSFQLVKDKFYFVDNGRLNWYQMGDGKVAKTGSLPFVARYEVDRTDRLVQLFGETWRVLNTSFYDPEMHHVDWQGVYEKYLPVVKQMIYPEEYYFVVYEMFGELNASHLGAYGDESFEGEAVRTPELGFEVLRNPEGEGLLVGHVLEDSPATKDETLIREGEVLLNLDGRPLSWDVNFWKMLDETQGRQINFEVRNAEGEVREVPFRPVSSWEVRNLSYEEWVEDCRERVDEWSGGRVGYVHIRSMNGSSLRRFEREVFVDYLDKEALIIDVRFNGGGMIHEDLINLLDRRQYGWGQYRDDEYVPRPYRRFEGPMVVMMNQNSYSDAEIFPDAFRAVGLGKLVGTPTTGTVIGTSSYTLIDGSRMRVPLGGWYSKDGTNLELKGVEPDILVEMHPDDVRADRDPQLRAAVKELLSHLDTK